MKLQHEIRVLLHLASKVDPARVDYRPTPNQRSLLELLQYLTIMPLIHLRGIKADPPQMPGSRAFDMQLFLYLKAGGREELSTMNLWAGMDLSSQASTA